MKHKLLFLIMAFLLTVSCDKDDTTHEKVELYLIDSYSKSEDGRCRIDESSVITKDSPLIGYADFLSYDSKDYAFELSGNAIEKIKKMEFSVHGVPFAIKVDNVLIYTGYLWPSYSSASCDWTTIDPIIFEDNKLKVRLGYPGPEDGDNITDKRNDKRIINTFKQDNKLK